MRTLKKTLCLVLCLAMMAGLCAISASAAFTDADEIKYEEAVAVLTGIGVIDGFEVAEGEYEFQPDGTLTRAQACKILAKLLGIDQYAGECTFADCKDHWAKSYIAACAAEGIVAGYDADTFGPDDLLTGSAWAKMLLCAVGYNAEFEGMVGADWEYKTIKLAKNADVNLTKGIATGFVLPEQINRDAACQMAFTALTVTMKEFNPGTKIEGTGLTITAGGGYNKEYIGHDLLTDVFEAKRENGYDDFGRPEVVYSQKNKAGIYIPTVIIPAEPVLTSDDYITPAELYNTLGYKATIKADKSYVTSTAKWNVYNVLSAGEVVNVSEDYEVYKKDQGVGAPGIQTEIYKLGTTDNYIVIQIRAKVAKVSTPISHKANGASGAYVEYPVAGLNLKQYTSVVNPKVDVDNFEADAALAKGDYVWVYGNEEAGYTVEHAELVKGKMTSFSKSLNSYTIDGVAYPVSYADAYTDTLVKAASSFETADFGAEATFVLDAAGNVVGTITTTTPTNYLFALSVDYYDEINSTTKRLERVYEVTGITPEGELVSVPADEVGGLVLESADFAHYENIAPYMGTLYTYTVDSRTGVYTFSDSPAGETVTSVVNKKISIGENLYANANTKFFVANPNPVTHKYDAVTTYAGIAAVPTMAGDCAYGALDVTEDGVCEIVFVKDGTAALVTTSYVYLTGDYTYGNGKYTYSALNKDAEASYVISSGFEGAGLYTITTGEADLIDASAADDDAVFYKTIEDDIKDGVYGHTKKYFSYDAGLLVCGESAAAVNTVLTSIAENIPVYTYDETGCTVSTAADLAAATGSVIVLSLNKTTGAVVAIYIVK